MTPRRGARRITHIVRVLHLLLFLNGLGSALLLLLGLLFRSSPLLLKSDRHRPGTPLWARRRRSTPALGRARLGRLDEESCGLEDAQALCFTGGDGTLVVAVELVFAEVDIGI